MEEDSQDYYNIYLTQFTTGCDCPYCNCEECFSCPNFKYIDYETNDLEELAESYKENKDRICPNLSPFVIDLQIFDDIYDFQDWVSAFINGKRNDIDFFYKILSKPDVFSLSFNTDTDFTYSDFLIDEQSLTAFASKLSEKRQEIKCSQKIHDLLIHYFGNNNPLSIHNLRGVVFSYFLIPYMEILDLIDFLSILHKFMCKTSTHHSIFYNQILKLRNYSEMVINGIKSIISQLVSSRNFLDMMPVTHILSTILFDLYIFDTSSPPYFPHKTWEISTFPQIVESTTILKILLSENGSYNFFTVPFEYKASLKDRFSEAIKNGKNPLSIKVRRDDIIESMNHLQFLSPEEFQKPLLIEFIGEQGYDRGGVSREFFHLITIKLFSLDFGMFDIKQDFYWFRSVSCNDIHFKTLGILVGLAVSNSMLLPIRFPLLFYKKILGINVTLDDLEEIDSELVDGLRNLKTLAENGEDISDLDLRFEVTRDNFGTAETIPLIPNGSNIVVNNENIDKYIKKYVNWLVDGSIKRQFNYFIKGFCDALGPVKNLLRMFFPEDLDILISGKEEYDWDEFKQSTNYSDGYDENSESIKIFWKIFFEFFNQDQKIVFLMFVTGSNRVPIQGMKEIKLRIQKSTSTNLLPVAHTCAGILQLPDYKDEEKMKRSLLICLDNCEGFGVI